MRQRSSSSGYESLHSFGSGNDGSMPDASLIDVNGTLYGTTICGGEYGNSACISGSSGQAGGTVFSISTTGKEKVLHSFGNSSDGSIPLTATLVDVNGTLYGTTAYGGKYGEGTVFSISIAGKEKVLHSFGSGSDGANPEVALIDVGGTLYSTTGYGGANSVGTVFSITTTGTEHVLYSFGNVPDGRVPVAALIYVKGKLYGTTIYGGSHEPSSDEYCCGVVFSVTTAGKEKVLHSFNEGPDGRDPDAGLVDLKGTLYGTTVSGGTNEKGAIFGISPGGKESVVFSFDGSDGFNPYDEGLIAVKGVLYGTATYGGGGGGSTCYSAGCGTVFSVSTGGTQTVLHSFGTAPDGQEPSAALLDVSGTLYGTASRGGAYGDGTVFSVKP